MKKLVILSVLVTLLGSGCIDFIPESELKTKTFENDYIKVTIPHNTLIREESETRVTLIQFNDVVRFELNQSDSNLGFESEINDIKCRQYGNLDNIGKSTYFFIPYGDKTIQITMITREKSGWNKLIEMVLGTLELKESEPEK